MCGAITWHVHRPPSRTWRTCVKLAPDGSITTTLSPSRHRSPPPPSLAWSAPRAAPFSKSNARVRAAMSSCSLSKLQGFSPEQLVSTGELYHLSLDCSKPPEIRSIPMVPAEGERDATKTQKKTNGSSQKFKIHNHKSRLRGEPDSPARYLF